MLRVTGLDGTSELIANPIGLRISQEVSGDKTLAFSIVRNNNNEHAFNLTQYLARIEVLGETFVVTNVKVTGKGATVGKTISAVHEFFYDLFYAEPAYTTMTGSKTLAQTMLFALEGTGYSASVIDSFTTKTLTEYGNDNRSALFHEARAIFGAEFTVAGKTVSLRRKIGINSDAQFRFGHNTTELSQEFNVTNLFTVVRGFGGKPNDAGVYPIDVTYRSPNADIYGENVADPIYDEKITTVGAMQTALAASLTDEPEVSVTLNFIDLRNAGYEQARPGIGDYVFVIYEPMEVSVEARIVAIATDYDANLTPANDVITLSNLRRRASDESTKASGTSKTLRKLLSGDIKLPYNALDEAVRLATEALQSAQTELIFENGITGIDPTNPNLLTRFTSAGFGVSKDGGLTFPNAITGYGVTTELLTAGQINANNVSIGNNNVMLDYSGLGVYSGSTLTAKLTGGYLNFYDFVTGESVGRFQSSFLGGSPETKGISLNLDNNKYISFGYYKDAEFGYQRLMSINADLYSTNAGKFGVNFLSDGHLNGRTLYFDDIGNTTGIRTALTNDAQGTERRVMALLGNNGVFMMDVDGAMGGGMETYSKRIGFFEDNNYLFGPAGQIGNTRSYTDFWMGDRSLRFGIDQFHNQSAIYNSANNDLIIASYGGIGLSYIGAGGATSSRLTVDSNSVDIWQDLDMHGWKIINSSTINDIITRLNALESA